MVPLTLREACRRLGIRNQNWLRGVVDALGIQLQPWGKSLIMTEADFRRVKRFVERHLAAQAVTAAAS